MSMGGPWRTIYGIRHRANRIAAGLCDKCQNPAAPGRFSCEEHLKRASERQRERRAQERMSDSWQSRKALRPPRPTPIERIMTKVAFEPNTGCWLWLGKTTTGGYSSVWLNGRSESGHRAMYLLTVGPVPDGMELDHKCRVTCCVNPSHLEPVSTKVNMQRRGDARTHCRRGHILDSRNAVMRFNKTLGRWARQCRRCECINSKRHQERRQQCA